MIEGALDVISQSKMVFCLFTGMVITLLPYAPLSTISVDQDTNGNDSAFIQVTPDICLYKHRVEPRRNWSDLRYSPKYWVIELPCPQDKRTKQTKFCDHTCSRSFRTTAASASWHNCSHWDETDIMVVWGGVLGAFRRVGVVATPACWRSNLAIHLLIIFLLDISRNKAKRSSPLNVLLFLAWREIRTPLTVVTWSWHHQFWKKNRNVLF